MRRDGRYVRNIARTWTFFFAHGSFVFRRLRIPGGLGSYGIYVCKKNSYGSIYLLSAFMGDHIYNTHDMLLFYHRLLQR